MTIFNKPKLQAHFGINANSCAKTEASFVVVKNKNETFLYAE